MSTEWTTDPMPGGGRTTIATYAEYRDAERAVDWLSDQGFDVGSVAIVGTGLRSVERIGGRMTTGRAAAIGAGQGALIGLLFALLFGLFFTGPHYPGMLLYGLVLGTLFGAILGALAHAAQGGGDRDFTSTRAIQADRYEVQVEHAHADEARRLVDARPRGGGSRVS